MDAALAAPSRSGPAGYTGVALALIVATIAGAFVFQAAGYLPCELCLKERLPYYAGIALAAVTLAFALRGPQLAARAGLALLVLLFLVSAGFGAYHAGVEWGFWPGPTDCTGALAHPRSNADFMNQLRHTRVVRCDAVAIRVLGLSLAGWNAVVSIVIVSLAAAGLRRS